MTAYWKKLQDPRWQKKRLEAMENSQFSCEICGDKASMLQVHHKEYFKDRNPWEYNLNQLAVLCEECHEYFHENKDVLKEISSILPLAGPNSREEIAWIIAGYVGVPYENLVQFLNTEESEFTLEKHNLGKQINEG
jgi:hypothetical protein